MQELIKVMKALSDETRLRIINVLLERECCVCEVMQALDISQSRASRNLNALYNVGFLNMRKDSHWSLYSINKGSTNHVFELVKVVDKALEGNKTARLDLKRLQKAERVGPGCVQKVSVKQDKRK